MKRELAVLNRKIYYDYDKVVQYSNQIKIVVNEKIIYEGEAKKEHFCSIAKSVKDGAVAELYVLINDDYRLLAEAPVNSKLDELVVNTIEEKYDAFISKIEEVIDNASK